MEIENIDSNMSKVDEGHIEQLLSEKLMEGYVLLEKSCPACSTPLVKNQHEDEDEEPIEKEIEPVMIPKGMFTSPFKPVVGVPFCVACTSHVVTQESETIALQKSGSLKIKGGISVAMSRSVERVQPEIIDVTQIEDNESVFTHDTKKDDQLVEEMLTEYSVRRDIATKVLGAKMLQGYSLMEQQCKKCSMPTMEFEGMIECVVCPALVKKAKKKLKAQKKLEKETGRLESEINRVRSLKAKEIELATIEEQKRHEETVKREKERMELEAKERELRTLQEQEAEHLRRLEIIEAERRRIAALEAEQARLIRNAMTQAELEAQRDADRAKTSAMKAQEDQMKLEEIRRVKAQSMEEEHKEATQKRKQMESKILEDSKRLEEMEQRRKMGLITALESMNRDVLVAEHRRRLEAKAKLDLQIARLEEDIMNEEMETKTVTEEKRAEDDERMIALLEQEAAEKARAAEEAIRKAKAALEHVHSARREVIAQTIALAEQDVIAEAESLIKREREDYKAPVILPSDSQIRSENWETLRTEGRSIMTRRVMVGWVLLSEFCQGVECHSSPLITKDGKRECVVCGGCGDGTDGAYIDVEDYDVVPSDEQLQALRERGVMPDVDGAGYEITRSTPKLLSFGGTPTVEEIQQDFETKRNMVSTEIGKRMLAGWTLLDSSCPQCVMPLMMDPAGNTDVCVLCGLVNTIQKTDGSTIKTVDVPTKTVFADKAPNEFHRTEMATIPSDSQTQSYAADAETMFTTLPTVRDTVNARDAVKESSEIGPSTDHDHLAKTIRESTQRQPSAMSRNDPPAASEPKTGAKKALEPDAAGTKTNANIESLPIGMLDSSMSKEEEKDIVDFTPYEFENGDVIHLEDVPSPKNFKFDMVPSEDADYTSKKNRPYPEGMGSRMGMPPRPDSALSPRRPPRSTTSRSSPHNGKVIITGGPSDVTSLGEMSRAESVATDALDSILDRIDAAKATLLRDDVTVQEQLEAANLIEKLAQAAVAVKALERADRF